MSVFSGSLYIHIYKYPYPGIYRYPFNGKDISKTLLLIACYHHEARSDHHHSPSELTSITGLDVTRGGGMSSLDVRDQMIQDLIPLQFSCALTHSSPSFSIDIPLAFVLNHPPISLPDNPDPNPTLGSIHTILPIVS